MKTLIKRAALATMIGLSTPTLASVAYVSNEKDNTLSVIDTETQKVIETIDVGQRPRGILLSKDYTKLYICASDDDTVQVLDLATRKIVDTLPSGEDPEQFALHPNNKHLYIANEDDAIVTVVDVDSKEVLAQIDVGIEPEGMAVSPNGKWAVNTSETTSMLHWINTETFEIEKNIVVGQRPRHVEFSKDSKTAWASAEIGGTVHIIDVENLEQIHEMSFKVPGVNQDRVQPVGIELTSDGKYAFVALGPSNHVAVVDAKTYEVLDYLLVGARVWQLDLDKDETHLYTTNGVSGDVSVINLEDMKVIKSFKVPGVNQDRVQPVGIELTSDGKYAFVALGPSNHVAVVDAKTYEVLDYLLVGARVWQLDLDKDETHLYTTNGVSGDVSVINLEDMKVIKSIKVGRYPWGVVIDPTS